MKCLDGVATILPEALESAMTSLMRKLEMEAKLASQMSGEHFTNIFLVCFIFLGSN